MFMDRIYVGASAKPIYTAGADPIKINLWVPSQLDASNEATHVFVHKNEAACTRYKGIELLMETVMHFVLEPYETMYAVTEDQAILGVSTEPI